MSLCNAIQRCPVWVSPSTSFSYFTSTKAVLNCQKQTSNQIAHKPLKYPGLGVRQWGVLRYVRGASMRYVSLTPTNRLYTLNYLLWMRERSIYGRKWPFSQPASNHISSSAKAFGVCLKCISFSCSGANVVIKLVSCVTTFRDRVAEWQTETPWTHGLPV